ncbi:MAG: Asp-tRNA(Asn)/Glu-tRNA(Gln) amidotransferase subunit GatC [Vulcanimicrobiota bacterium]
MKNKTHINPGQVEHIANLARIELKPGDREVFTSQLENILIYVGKLQELETDNIDPTFQLNPAANILKKDKVHSSLAVEEALMNAPAREDDFFKIPPILESNGSA